MNQIVMQLLSRFDALNYQGEICYRNIRKDVAEKHLEDFHISDHLPIDYAVSYEVENYSITVNKVALDKEKCYLILIQPQGDLHEYVYRDSLTNLYNRKYWDHLLAGGLKHHMPKRFAIVVIDIDNLKGINDCKGHLAGDKAIWIVGKCIIESIRKQDIAIRYGGDEFIILLANPKEEKVEKVICQIKEDIRERGKKENIHIEISAGVAYSNHTCEIRNIIAIADSEMYKEKAGKKIIDKHIVDELLEIKREIEKLRGEYIKIVNWNQKDPAYKELMGAILKLENMLENHLKSV